jgi:hypothetical protein
MKLEQTGNEPRLHLSSTCKKLCNVSCVQADTFNAAWIRPCPVGATELRAIHHNRCQVELAAGLAAPAEEACPELPEDDDEPLPDELDEPACESCFAAAL